MANEKNQVFSNYIPISRKLFEHDFWEEDRVFSRAEAWIDIVRSASWEENNSRIINGRWVKWDRGQWPVSLRFLGDRWKWSRSKASKFLEDLSKEKMIEIVTDGVTAQTIISVCKYDEYNPVSQKKRQQKRHRSDSDVTSEGQRSDKVNNSNKVKEEKEETAPHKKSVYGTFVDWINQNAPKVNQMESPITEEEFSRLLKDFPGVAGKELIKDVLTAMHNSKDLVKKYVSANLTLRNWIKRRREKDGLSVKGESTGQTGIGQLTAAEQDGKRMMEEYGK